MSRIRTNLITNRMANGAPTVSHGLVVAGVTTITGSINNLNLTGITTSVQHQATNVNVTGVVTATSFVGSGPNLTGIDATAVKDSGGNVKIQAQASGAVYTGIHTFTGHTFHQDNDHSKFGTGGDMSIYHDNTHNYIDCEAGTLKIRLTSGADFIELQQDRDVWIKGTPKPWDNNTYDLGTASYRWRNIYTNDLNLSNEDSDGNSVDGTTGNWTIQEGKDELYVINNITGKKYKMMLKEVD